MARGVDRKDTRTAGQHLIEAPYWSRHISREEWRSRILALDQPLRGAVAAIVWWDVFSVRMWSDRWNDIDDLIGTGEAVAPEQLVAGLVTVGYTENRAFGRVYPRQNAGAKGRPKLSKELTV
jgi:hypothetical protein